MSAALVFDPSEAERWRRFNAAVARGGVAPAPQLAIVEGRLALLETIIPAGLPRGNWTPSDQDKEEWGRNAERAAPLLERIDRLLEEDV